MNLTDKRARQSSLQGTTYRVQTGCGKMYVTVNCDESGPFEIFAHLGKSGTCSKCQIEALTRAITLGLRCGVPLSEYATQLVGLRCPQPHLYPKNDRTYSCPDGIARTLANFLGIKLDEDILAIAQQESLREVNGVDYSTQQNG